VCEEEEETKRRKKKMRRKRENKNKNKSESLFGLEGVGWMTMESNERFQKFERMTKSSCFVVVYES
jgi:hypothetical protein